MHSCEGSAERNWSQTGCAERYERRAPARPLWILCLFDSRCHRQERAAGFRGGAGRSMGPFSGVRRLPRPDTGSRTRANGTDQYVQSTTPQDAGERSVSPVSSQPRPTTKKARDARVLHRLAAALLRLPPSRVELPKHCTRPSPRREQQPPATADRMTPAESCDYAIVAMLLVWKLMIAT